MCVIVVANKGHQFNREEFDSICETYTDGLGVVTDTRYLRVVPSQAKEHPWYNSKTKTYSTYKINEYDAKHLEDLWGVIEDATSFMLHGRQATHGGVTIENTHPYKVPALNGKPVYFAHNGIMTGYDDDVDSDSLVYAKQRLFDRTFEEMAANAERDATALRQKFALFSQGVGHIYGSGWTLDKATNTFMSNTSHQWGGFDRGGTACNLDYYDWSAKPHSPDRLYEILAELEELCTHQEQRDLINELYGEIAVVESH